MWDKTPEALENHAVWVKYFLSLNNFEQNVLQDAIK